MRIWVGMWDFLFRHGLRKTLEPSIPVISVGNLTYGGTNKTPFVEMLCKLIEASGVSPGVVSRGYGGNNPDVRVVESGKISGLVADRRYVGDEPILLSARLPGVPVAVSRNRVKGLEELKRRGVKLAVADDAFQHRRVARDVDIVLIDAACSFGSGRLIPAGTLREPVTALRRAHIVVITKVDQADASKLSSLRKKISEFVPENRIFNARFNVVDWAAWENGRFRSNAEKPVGRRVMAFSAIGNPDSFIRSLEMEGAVIAGARHFRDHHSYSEYDMNSLVAEMETCGADYLTCTEKDIYNLPAAWRSVAETPENSYLPLLIPRVVTVLDEPERFAEALLECLRPRLVVASNGYGEDAIGALLAKKLASSFPSAEVVAFPLVGRGESYKEHGVKVVSTPSVTPSGGLVKYKLGDLLGDIRAGLLGHIRDQQCDWRGLARGMRTPVCVGDVYLLFHALWGQGIAPLFVATAKTVYLSGHWRLERFIIRRFSRKTWTRDSDSAAQLAASGADAIYAGNPVMDLLGDVSIPEEQANEPSRPLVMLLPGSRSRAYDDVKMLLGAALILHSQKHCDYVMTLAPTISPERLISACEGWEIEENSKLKKLKKNGVEIQLHQGDVSSAAVGARLLIGLGGTANQLCAGMGVPVVSIDEKGKRVQKKLLEDSELLAEPTPEALADCALKVLTSPELHATMSRAGRARMGTPGALDSVVKYVDEELGWGVRCDVYSKLRETMAATN